MDLKIISLIISLIGLLFRQLRYCFIKIRVLMLLRWMENNLYNDSKDKKLISKIKSIDKDYNIKLFSISPKINYNGNDNIIIVQAGFSEIDRKNQIKKIRIDMINHRLSV